MPEGYSAFNLALLIGAENVSGFQRYDTESGLFETAGIGSNGVPAGINFEITSGEGYFIINRDFVE